MVAPQQQFCVRWNSYHSNLQNAFPKLLTSEHFVDVTLACDNGLIKCHKVVLSACSNYFENILIQNPCQHPTIVLKDMKCTEVQALVDFMYKGEVNVTQDDLPNLLKAAECLQIRGLSGSEQCLNQMNIRSQGTPQTACPPLTPVSSTQAQHTPSTSTPVSTTATQSVVPEKTITVRPDHELKKKKPDVESPKKSESSASVNQTVKDEHDDKNDDSQDEYDYEDFKIKNESVKEEEITYNDEDLDMDYLEADDDANESILPGPSASSQQSDYNPIANVSCFYSSQDNHTLINTKRIRRSEAELRQAADCITRGQTFQNVSDQFNIPISTIRFFMARKGILPRRKRGRSSANMMSGGFHSSPVSGGDRSGNSSPIGPPFHIVHYKLPELGPKLK